MTVPSIHVKISIVDDDNQSDATFSQYRKFCSQDRDLGLIADWFRLPEGREVVEQAVRQTRGVTMPGGARR